MKWLLTPSLKNVLNPCTAIVALSHWSIKALAHSNSQKTSNLLKRQWKMFPESATMKASKGYKPCRCFLPNLRSGV
jgi:hypothetical protein